MKHEFGIVAFRAPAELIARIEAAATYEGISKSDVVRRAVMRDLDRQPIRAGYTVSTATAVKNGKQV